MNRRSLFALILAAAVLPALAQQSTGKDRVVFQVSDNDPAKWNLALNNARNVQQDLGKDNVQIEIVAYACENTMQNTKVKKSEIYGGISYVQAGVTHIMKRQREGWAYIRP